MNTIDTVSGIMFSIGIGLVVIINMLGVKNFDYIKSIRGNLNQGRDSYILYFSLSTLGLILDKYVRDFGTSLFFYIKGTEISFNVSIFILFWMLYFIAYYIVNFLALQKLNNDIFDRLNQS